MTIKELLNNFATWLIGKLSFWLTKEGKPTRGFLSDFNHICSEVRPTDVILVEGSSRASVIIKHVTQSAWSHAALYIGNVNEIKNKDLVDKIKENYNVSENEQLIIETEIGVGTIISPLTKYSKDHLRILRPRNISTDDKEKIVAYAVNRLGGKYNFRHIFDLARFLFPWGLYPRRWRSTLFQHNALKPTEDICSSMIARAFHAIDYPILPLVTQDEALNYEITRRNPDLFTPSDFDYSPYFDVIKYPIFPLSEEGEYHRLRWKSGISDE